MSHCALSVFEDKLFLDLWVQQLARTRESEIHDVAVLTLTLPRIATHVGVQCVGTRMMRWEVPRRTAQLPGPTTQSRRRERKLNRRTERDPWRDGAPCDIHFPSAFRTLTCYAHRVKVPGANQMRVCVTEPIKGSNQSRRPTGLDVQLLGVFYFGVRTLKW